VCVHRYGSTETCFYVSIPNKIEIFLPLTSDFAVARMVERKAATNK
jgi:hypothetical protein